MWFLIFCVLFVQRQFKPTSVEHEASVYWIIQVLGIMLPMQYLRGFIVIFKVAWRPHLEDFRVIIVESHGFDGDNK